MEGRVVEEDVVYRMENGGSIKNDTDLAEWIGKQAEEAYKAKGEKASNFQVLQASMETDANGLWIVRARVKMELYGKTEISKAGVEMAVPFLVTELNILAAVLLKGSIFEPLTSVLQEMISIVVPRHAVWFYCGPDTGDRPGKKIVLSIFKAIEDFFGEMEVAAKEKNEVEDILAYMRRKKPRTVSAIEVVTRLLASANVPLHPDTAVNVITTWFCDPVTMARAFDRVLQFPTRVIEPTTVEPVSEKGAAKIGKVAKETCKDDFAEAIGASIQSVVNAGGVNTGVRVMERLILFLGAQKYVGKKLDESLDPTIDVHIMNAVLLQKFLSGPQTPGMPNDDSCAEFFYVRVLGNLIDEYVPKPVRSSAKKAVATVAVVTMRSDMLQDLVFNFVLPQLCISLEELKGHAVVKK
jgi:hypothetical protein